VPAATNRLLALAALALAACGAPDRAPGERAPRPLTCHSAGLRCLLPWPSNAFTVADATTATGLRVRLSPESFDAPDDLAAVNHADGFSRVTPVLEGFSVAIDPASLGVGAEAAVRLVVAQPGPDFGHVVPVRLQLVRNDGAEAEESLVLAYPLVPLAPGSDYVAVVLDSLRARDGAPLAPAPEALIALGLSAPKTEEDRALARYHGPARAALAAAGLDPARVLRLWDFTTRSKDDPLRRVKAMRAAAERAEVTVTLDEVQLRTGGPVAAVVLGHLRGVPEFRGAAGRLVPGPDGLPLVQGAGDAVFRVVLPAGRGPYRVVMYGHGTAGNVRDDLFDERIAAEGVAKVGIEFAGWNGDGVFDTFTGFTHMMAGVDKSTADLAQSLANEAAIERALSGVLGDALAAPKLGDRDNPAAGRRPDAAELFWAGGSLGGTMGFVVAGASPRVRAAILNVPGAGWSHFVGESDTFQFLDRILRAAYPDLIDLRLAVAVSQLAWDDVDGANWVDESDDAAYLVQESMGDPILPNPGTELVAAAARAAHVGAVLAPVTGTTPASEAVGRSGLTQFRVAATRPLDIHGFAGKSGPAGDAAREQISAFLRSALAGSPRIEVPPLCRENTPAGSCDFGGR
jgi:hypothetical protein